MSFNSSDFSSSVAQEREHCETLKSRVSLSPRYSKFSKRVASIVKDWSDLTTAVKTNVPSLSRGSQFHITGCFGQLRFARSERSIAYFVTDNFGRSVPSAAREL